MTKPTDARSTSEELAFFGAVTASLCHEMKNVLATIDELSGLLNDLGSALDPARAIDRLPFICERISRQVDRGEALIGRMHRFSHSAKQAARRLDLNDLVAETVELSRRAATLQQVTLEAREVEPSVTARLVPFAAAYAVHAGIHLALCAAVEERAVTVAAHADDAGPKVVVTSADPFHRASAPEPEVQRLESLVAQLGGRIGWVQSPGADDRLEIWFGGA